MYQDLADTQRATPLERFVMTSLVPTLLITSFLHAEIVWAVNRTNEFVSRLSDAPVFVGIRQLWPRPRTPEIHVGAAVVFAYQESGSWVAVGNGLPVLYRFGGSPITYPKQLRDRGASGQVVLQADVSPSGVVDPSSITIVSATNAHLVSEAREILSGSQFRSRSHQPVRVTVRVRVAIWFT